MVVLCLLSVIVGLYLMDVARVAFGYDEPGAGLIAGSTGAMFILLGFKAWP